jgi:anthranilate synthase/aminodeoxychorismate synthase-like glutamine amidotransferase
MLLLIDNYDSFTYNLAQYLGELGAPPVVRRNDEIDLAGIEALGPRRIVVSPGPGRPEDAGVSVEAIRRFGGRVPVLGVCLGHQAIGVAFGAEVARAPVLMHGKTSLVEHDGRGVFKGLASPFEAGRYHSLVVTEERWPPDLEVAARTVGDGTIMAIRHRRLPVHGVQFHPESVLTRDGRQMLRAFLEM